MKSNIEEAPGTHRRIYLIIFGILLVLTGIEVFISTQSGILKIPLLVASSIAKALLVVFFYMHLKDEMRYYMLVFFVPFILVIPLLLMISQ
ncbi:MAG: cytochrome C oxidase subunit IV family protein [Anaerolineae bacterium]